MSYVFDTNVLAEVMREEAHPAVAAWLRACPPDAMFTTAVSRGEVFFGVRRLAEGSKRRRLERAARAMFEQEFPERVLPFDAAAADAYADIRIVRRRQGMPISTEDGMIAAIAKVRGAAVVTRDVGGFEGCGVDLVNPWEA